MKKLLIVCGPTATGKTPLALRLAKRFSGELISADSRQVYKYMDIVTGKDIPKGAKWRESKIHVLNLPSHIGFWETDDKLRLWGYDLVKPSNEFSVAHYIHFSTAIISDIHGRGKLPILVGGTGLYLKGAVDGIDTATIPKNQKLRDLLEGKSVSELYELLSKLDSRKADSLNESDKKNSRRLVRAIEVVKIKERSVNNKHDYNSLWIGINIGDRKKLFKNIDERVNKRTGPELDKEMSFLREKGYFNAAPLRTIGYVQWMQHLEGKLKRKEAVRRWKIAEHAYAKRQITWFKKQKSIHWFDVSKSDYERKVEEKVNTWHNIGRKDEKTNY